MKIKNMKLKLKDEVEVKMMDNGHWEYDRIGVGVLNDKVFVCDLEFVNYDDVMDESDFKCFWFVNFESVEECCLSGLESGWCEEWKKDEGYGEDDRFRVKVDDDVDVELFDKWVKVNEVK
jgi:hypothetical protein